jgi:hypothetical protein
VPKVEVALEIGKKRTFASALAWPGWARSGRDEETAIEALLTYAPRYGRVIARRRLGFEEPNGVSVVERQTGNATTDFGAPDMAALVEAAPVGEHELKRLLTILDACWDAFEIAAEAAEGKELQKGPRGGGRPVDKIAEHVLGAHQSYLRKIFWREKLAEGLSLAEAIAALRRAAAEVLPFAVSGEMPERGPRGGELWKPRYFVRRAAWHILDHAWELEDKTID